MIHNVYARTMIKSALLIGLASVCLFPMVSQAERTEKVRPRPTLRSHHQHAMSAHFDIRRQESAVRRQALSPKQLTALQQLRGQIEDLQARFHPATSTLRHLFSLSQRLTPPRRDDPVTIALDFLQTHRGLFRIRNGELKDLTVVKNYRTQHNGMTHLTFKQFYQGLEVFQGHIKVNLDHQGQILSVHGTYFPSMDTALSPTLTAAEAAQIAADNLAPDLDFTPTLKTAAKGNAQATTFAQGPFTQDVTAYLVLFPSPQGARLAWKTRLHLRARIAWYDTLVDAHTGDILFYHNLYKSDSPRGLVFDINPDQGPQVLHAFTGDPVASPDTWVSPLPNLGTQGNNVITIPSVTAADQHFEFPFDNTYEREGVNTFDLQGQLLRFTPNEAGGYDAASQPLRFDDDLGLDITGDLSFFGFFPSADDGHLRYPLDFTFSFFGEPFRSIFISANGYVSFGTDDISFFDSWVDLILGVPRIAALWDDLNPGAVAQQGTGGVFVKRADDRVVITWSQVPEFDQEGTNTVQLTLLDTGVIEMAFVNVTLLDAVVGISRGRREQDLQPVDFSADLPMTGTRDGMAEKFPTRELGAAATNLFYHLNLMHDTLYNLGFDEAAGNFQLDNFGRGGIGGDPVLAWPQDIGTNNAFFGTPEDGISPFTAFLFFTNPPFRQVDSSFDTDIIYHEYVHGLTTRLVGNPFDIAVLDDVQSGAMGEGWSDAYAISITDNPVAGEYSTGNAERGIRSVNYATSTLRYGDFGNRFGPISNLLLFPVEGGIALDRTFIPQVHRDGEIWASTLWDLRTALGRGPFEQLITDGLKLTPANPSMLAGRDAILLTDMASNGGANEETIWAVFAARGMGFSAQSNDGYDTAVFQAFDTPSNPLPTNSEAIFFDDVESGINGWTVEGTNGTGQAALWHPSARRGSTAWYYGQEFSGHYNTGARNFGALISPVINLPAISASGALVLEFDQFLQGEPAFILGDNGYVIIRDPAAGTLTQVAGLINNTVVGFEHRKIDLSRFAEREIQIVFYFDTIDDLANDNEGWYIDNVRVSRFVR